MTSFNMRQASVFVLGTLLFLSGCGKGTRDTARETSAIRNSDIKWRGDYLGVQPYFENPQLDTIVASHNPSVDDELYAMTVDPDRWIAAHVLLSLRESRRGETYRVSGGEWNHLKVRLRGTDAQIEATQQASIRELWEQSRRQRVKSQFSVQESAKP